MQTVTVTMTTFQAEMVKQLLTNLAEARKKGEAVMRVPTVRSDSQTIALQRQIEEAQEDDDE